MIDASLMAAILDSLKDPLLLADTSHTVLYMNRRATTFYDQGTGLLGRSLLDCHNQRSQQMMTDILAAMHAGEDERLITDDAEQRVYMRAVRAPDGQLLGYYERYECKEKAQ